MKTLTEINKAQQERAAQRWRLILELSKTMSPSEIGAKLGMSRSRASQLIKQAREYFRDNGQTEPLKGG